MGRAAAGEIPVQVLRSSFESVTAGYNFTIPGLAGHLLNGATRFDLLFVGGAGSQGPFLMLARNGSELRGNPSISGDAIFRPESQLQPPVFAAALDPSAPGGFLATFNTSDLLTFSGTGGQGRVAVYRNGSSRGVDSDQTPIQSRSGFSVDGGATAGGQLAFDRFSGALYVSNLNQILVFNRFRGKNSPDRIINLPCQGLVLDRTH